MVTRAKSMLLDIYISYKSPQCYATIYSPSVTSYSQAQYITSKLVHFKTFCLISHLNCEKQCIGLVGSCSRLFHESEDVDPRSMNLCAVATPQEAGYVVILLSYQFTSVSHNNACLCKNMCHGE